MCAAAKSCPKDSNSQHPSPPSSSYIFPGLSSVLFQEPWGEGFDAGVVASSAEHHSPLGVSLLER